MASIIKEKIENAISWITGLDNKTLYHFVIFPFGLPLGIALMIAVIQLFTWALDFIPGFGTLMMGLTIYLTLVIASYMVDREHVENFLEKLED